MRLLSIWERLVRIFSSSNEYHTGATPSHLSAASIASLIFLTASLGSHFCQLGHSPGAKASTRAPNVVPSFQSLVKFFTALSGIWRTEKKKKKKREIDDYMSAHSQVMNEARWKKKSNGEYLRLDPLEKSILRRFCFSFEQILVITLPHRQRDGIVQNQRPDQAKDELEFTINNVRWICECQTEKQILNVGLDSKNDHLIRCFPQWHPSWRPFWRMFFNVWRNSDTAYHIQLG